MQTDLLVWLPMSMNPLTHTHTHTKEIVSNLFNLVQHICHCGHTRDHVLILDLTLNTDDVLCLTQCYCQCHSKDCRRSYIFSVTQHQKKKKKNIVSRWSCVTIFLRTFTISDLSNNLFTPLLMIYLMVFFLKKVGISVKALKSSS